MYVLDATPLIYLATVERVQRLAELDAACVTPERVYDEVVTAGLDHGHADARRVERAVEDDIVTTVSVPAESAFDRLRHNQHLSAADAAVLAVADANDATAVMDDQYGRDVADAEAITTRGTAFLVLRLLSTDVITPEDAQDTIDAMLDAGWYCAPDLYARIRRLIDEFSWRIDEFS
jgi:predicted nucleic acid-binding protein